MHTMKDVVVSTRKFSSLLFLFAYMYFLDFHPYFIPQFIFILICVIFV